MSIKQEFQNEIEGCDYEELLEIKLRIQSEASMVRAKIDDAKTRLHCGEGHADPEWFRRANAALKVKGWQDQEIARHMSAAKRKRNEAQNQILERRFIAVARDVLSKDVFFEIMERARIEE